MYVDLTTFEIEHTAIIWDIFLDITMLKILGLSLVRFLQSSAAFWESELRKRTGNLNIPVDNLIPSFSIVL